MTEEDRPDELRRLVERERAAREQAERLVAAARAVSASIHLPSVLAAILGELRTVVPYDSASVQELRGDRLVIVGAAGFPDVAAVLGYELAVRSPDTPNTMQVFESRAPLILEDAWNTYPGFRAEPHAQAAIRSWLGVPLLFGERLIGMVTLDKHEPGFYTGEHAAVALAFAAQAAVALENARLYAASQRELAERTRMEHALRESESRYRELVETAVDVIYRLDPVGQFTYVNPTALRLFGFSEAEVLGRSYLDFVPPQWREAVAEFYWKQYFDLVPNTYNEIPIQPREGGERWFGCSVQLLLDASGMPSGFQAIARDVTDRKAAEEALRDSERYTRAILENAHDAFVSMDTEGRIREWNPAAAALFGWAREEVLGRPVADVIIPPRFREAHATGLARYSSTGESRVLNRQLELTALHRDGRELPVELSITAVHVRGRPVFHGLLRDITARKQIEEMREDLVRTMVHDLRTPLTSILGALEAISLVSPESLGDHQKGMLAIADRNGRRLLDLIESILDVNRLESGAMPLHLEDVWLATLAAEAVELQRPAAVARGSILLWEAAPGLPAVRADRMLMARVVENLVGNALKFTPEGGHVRVACGLDPGGIAVRISVEDDGPGIPAALRPRLFQKFATGDHAQSGSGLGLAFCRLAMEAQGGAIAAEAAPGGGARMVLRLPVAPPRPA